MNHPHDVTIEQLLEGPFFVFAGPCVVESYEVTLATARELKEVCARLGLPFVFKASYRKANRSSIDSFTGLGDEEALGILARVSGELGVPILTDVHLPSECAPAARVASILQIPAFLFRQTDLLLAAAETGRIVNIKKGQFAAPGAMAFAAEKVRRAGNERVLLTERGTMFGYQDLVVDFRGIPQMREVAPVVVDITHSLQMPNQASGVTGGQPALVEHMGRLAIASGADGVFFETHPDPSKALSDGANMIPLARVEKMLEGMVRLRAAMD